MLRADGGQPAAQPTFRAEVDLVEVTAVVTAEDGPIFADLTSSDFEVREDGSPGAAVSVRKLATAIDATGGTANRLHAVTLFAIGGGRDGDVASTALVE